MGSYSASDFEYIIKEHDTLTNNLSKRIYVNKIEKKITFKIQKRKYYLELLTSETIKLLKTMKQWSTFSKTTENKNGETVTHLEINEVVLMDVILLTIILSMIQELCMHLFLINLSVNY